jgi:hypothetical protein
MSIFAIAGLLAIAGSLLAGAPASPRSSPSCHGAKAAAASCHGEAPEAVEAPEVGSGCHGRHRSTVAERRSSRVAGRSAARADRAADRSERAASRAGCHGAKAAKPKGCHGSPPPAEAPAECDCEDDCDCG